MSNTNPEIQQYILTLDDLRGQVAAMIKDLPAEGLNWRPTLPVGADPTNSLAVLAIHIAGAEHYWIAECIGEYPATRVRDEEFAFVAESAEEPLRRLNAVGDETSAVLGGLKEADLTRTFTKEGRQVPARWAIHHCIFHASLHIGHMQLTYQLWADGKATTTSPRWFDRLLKN
ncbi:MAG: DinB family protein [Anaerolineales bacterium]